MHRAVVLLGGVLGGCSLTQSLDHLGYDGGTGGAGQSGATSAAGPGPGGSTSTGDTATSSSLASGSTASTGGTGGGGGGAGGGSGGSGAGGGPTSPCSEPHAFCDDFEDGLGDWSYQIVDDTAGASLAISDAVSTSPSQSLRAFVPRLPDVDTPVYASTVKDFEGAGLAVHLRMQLRVEPAAWQDGDINTGVLYIACAAGGQTGPSLATSVGRDYVSIGFPHLSEGDGISLPSLPFGEWVAIDVTFDPSGSLTGTFAGQPVRQTWAPPPVAQDSCSVTVGLLGYNDPSPAFEVFVDDVVIDL